MSDAGYLRVKNLEKYQHYKDRCPPWIKLHLSTVRDYDFSCLQDASKAHLMLIWLLASQLDNRIPNDPDWVKGQTGMRTKPNLNLLIDRGFLVLEQDDSNTLADCNQSAMPETETEAYTKETETEPPISPKGDDSGFEEFWKSYPSGRKVGKKAALRSWKKLKPSENLCRKIVDSVRKQAASQHFEGSNGQAFIPNPSTWLNQGRWEDEISETADEKMQREIVEASARRAKQREVTP